MPLRATVSVGLTGSLLLMLSKAASAPVTVGVKVTLRVQFAPAAKVAPQLLVCVKSPALLLGIVMLLMVRGAVPLLDSVTV